MSAAKQLRTADVLERFQNELLETWTRELEATGAQGDVGQTRSHVQRFLNLLAAATREDGAGKSGGAWAAVSEFLAEFSTVRARAGYDSAQTATFIFSLKRPLFALLRRELANDPHALADEMWAATVLLDRLGLQTVSAYQRTREDIIVRQQQELLELSTPVVKLWDDVLAIPMVGTLDSARTQVMMEALLQRIVDTGSQIAILDITGVPTVDTLVAQHLLKTVTAIRLMGGECIISGVRAQIAQTIVHLGVDLQGITTKATLADALALALQRTGHSIVRSRPGA
jgi:rsbT co-antagonist protein RsbR